jgi:hypothetical protein
MHRWPANFPSHIHTHADRCHKCTLAGAILIMPPKSTGCPSSLLRSRLPACLPACDSQALGYVWLRYQASKRKAVMIAQLDYLQPLPPSLALACSPGTEHAERTCRTRRDRLLLLPLGDAGYNPAPALATDSPYADAAVRLLVSPSFSPSSSRLVPTSPSTSLPSQSCKASFGQPSNSTRLQLWSWSGRAVLK